GAADFTAKIWDLEAGKNELTLSGHFDMVNSVAFSPDGQRLATGSSDQLAKIWDLENGKELLSLFGHSDAVTCVAFSPDGQRLATGSGDQTVKIWELNPDVIIRKTTGNHRLAGLNLGQLIDYDLENLLETHPENEGILRASKAPLQIAAFAELYAQNTLNSSDLRRTLPYFARAARLYRCALDCGADSSLLQSLGNLYFKWAQDILASNRPDTAAAYIERSCQLYADKSECPNLWSLYSEKTGSAFNFQLFLAAEDLSELQGYGAYFFGKKRWNEAKQLYEKAESKQHAPEVLIKLFEISENRRETFNFNRFLASEEVYELYAYGYYFFEKQSWNEAKQLFEKVEASQHSPEALQYLFSIAAFRNEPFDFNRFLASEDVEELRSYGEYFLAHENWTQAKQVYEKAEAEQHTMDALTNLYAVSEKLGETFDFNRFLASEEDNELSYYGDYFLGNEKWAQAAQLYEKAEARQHSPEALKKLFEIAEKTGVAFNFNRFLMAEDPNELSDYAFFLVGKAQKFEKYTDWVPFYQDALLLREKQMKLDTSAAVRADASTEYNSVGYFQLFIPDGKAAEESLRRALELNPENKYIATNLAPALLLQGKYAAAEAEYKKWAPLPFNESGLATYRDGFLDDMKTMEEQGVSGFDYARVRAWLKE
ncbi:MAG: hypothetical protein ABIQ93_03870, partial [Saprospiraceae bacterium]